MGTNAVHHTETVPSDADAPEQPTYKGPLIALLRAGAPSPNGVPGKDPVASWWDYAARFAIGPEHADDLIRMATDGVLLDGASEPECWAPVHAWRAIGQLRVTRAIGPLLATLNEIDRINDDWGYEEIPEVIGMMGEEAVDSALRFAADRNNRLFARIAALRVPKESMRHCEPAAERSSAWIAALRRMLERFAEESPDFNAFVIVSLLDLRAAVALDDIRRAFESGHVDEFVAGGWEEICAEMLGLPPPPRKRPPFGPLHAGLAARDAGGGDAADLSAIAGEPVARMQQQWSKARKQRDRKQRKKRRT